jgi:hypothetical protein
MFIVLKIKNTSANLEEYFDFHKDTDKKTSFFTFFTHSAHPGKFSYFLPLQQ